MPLVLVPKPSIGGAMTLARIKPIALVIIVVTTLKTPHQWVRLRRIRLVCLIRLGSATRSLRNLSEIKPIGGILNRELQLCYLWG
jgi:hypothetical protein